MVSFASELDFPLANVPNLDRIEREEVTQVVTGLNILPCKCYGLFISLLEL